jgi:translation initiation factor 2B subunit (eIF-2B alpha/beta/delta family)
MKAAIRKEISTLKKDRGHGAGRLALQALEILRQAASSDDALSIESFTAEIGQACASLREARPGMVSIANCVTALEEEMLAAAADARSPQRLKKAVYSIASRLIKAQEKAAAAVGRHASKLVPKRGIVMTCSYSSAVCSALEAARRAGTDFKVLAMQSMHKKVSYGEMTAQRLAGSGITCRIVPDGQAPWHAARADLLLTGADSLSLHGWLVNGSPSLELAEAARLKRRPLYAACETAKFDLRGFLTGLYRPEPGFDIIPLEFFSGVVTEDGLFSVEQALDFNIVAAGRAHAGTG